jgi:RNA polymerase sigma factor (sigma-70 family)
MNGEERAFMREVMFQQAYPLTIRAAQVRSAAAVASGAILLADRDDVEQELLIRIWQALYKYDTARAGLRTFIEMVVRTQLVSMLRSHRHRPQFEPLDERHVIGDFELQAVELRADVGRVLAGMSAFDRAVALSLSECSTVETSRRLGVSRAAIYRAIHRLRLALTVAGLGRRESRATCRRIGCCRSKSWIPGAHR